MIKFNQYELSKSTVQMGNYSMECIEKKDETNIKKKKKKRKHWMREEVKRRKPVWKISKKWPETVTILPTDGELTKYYYNVELCPSERLIWKQDEWNSHKIIDDCFYYLMEYEAYFDPFFKMYLHFFRNRYRCFYSWSVRRMRGGWDYLSILL